MSNIHSAGQYELDYLPHRLGNWQVWDSKKLEPSTSAKAAQTQQRQATGFLVDDRGHILPGVKKVKNSFRTRLSPIYSAPCGWPKPSPAVGSPLPPPWATRASSPATCPATTQWSRQSRPRAQQRPSTPRAQAEQQAATVY